MRSFASAVVVPLLLSTIVSFLVVAMWVAQSPQLLRDVKASLDAAMIALTESQFHHSARRPQAVILPERMPFERPVSLVGPKRGDYPSHAPRYLDEIQSYEFYREMAWLKGLDVRRTTVLGLRGLSPTGRRHSSDDNASAYDDTFVILDPDRERAVEMLGATHAGEFSNPLSPQGIAQISPGLYQATPSGAYLGMSSWYVTTPHGSGYLPCRRDVNGNGMIDPEEKEKQFWASEILFHNGWGPVYGSSRGCQVLPPTKMTAFIEEVGTATSFDYLLIDANEKL